MQSVAVRSPTLAHALKATSFAVTASRPTAIGDAVDTHHHQDPAAKQPDLPPILSMQQPPMADVLAVRSAVLFSPPSGSILNSARSGQKAVSVAVGGARSSTGNHSIIRFYSGSHTDLKIPDFSAYRRPSTADPTKKPDRDAGRAFTYLIAGTCVASSVTFGKWFGTGIISAWSASKDVLALAKIEVNLNDIPAGKNVVLKWRGKPLFIKHRTPEEIERERAVDVSTLRDPQSDEQRVRGDPRWLVLLGVCTHLGCVPIAGQGEFGGYYCPCHGSHYDGAGRIRKGPAPLNLEIPEYEFLTPELLVVG